MSLYKEIRQWMKNDDRIEIYRFAMIWILCFGVFFAIEVFTRGVPLLFLVFAPLFTAVIVMFIIKKTSGLTASSFYGGRKAEWSIREQLAGDLEKIRFSKRQGRFEEALLLATNFLKHIPRDPEALFLKAQILHEGFGYSESAKKCLEIIMKEIPTTDTLHSWVSSYHKDITNEGDRGGKASLPGKD